MVKERPILFSGPMVRAILEGRKTQTRRVMKHQPVVAFWVGRVPQFCSTGYEFDSRGYSSEQLAYFCPYGKASDRLWVRETWRRADGLTVYYKADEPENVGAGWKPSIHMERRFSRISLEIVNVRVERLQDINEADAKAEGVMYYGDHDPAQDDYKNYAYNDKYGDDWGLATARESYQSLWGSINGKRKGCDWDSNPWVWVIEFQKAA